MPIDSAIARFWFVEPAELRTKPSQDYHESTKASEFLYHFNQADPKRTPAMMRVINTVAGKSKNYGYAPKIVLDPAGFDILSEPLGTLLANRRSRRRFGPVPMTFRQLSTRLVRGAGINGTIVSGQDETRDGRVYPSGGGLYPLEIYPLVLGVDGLEPGLYHFNVNGGCLHRLLSEDLRVSAQSAFMDETMLAKISVAFLITAVFKRSSFKYGERAYRLVHLEAGHMVQNLLLVGQALGLSVVPINGFFDRRLEDLIDIDGVEESILYTAIAGCPEA